MPGRAQPEGLQLPASGVIRLAAFCDLRDELRLHVTNSASDLHIRHPQEAGVNGCGVLHLEGGNDGITLQPEDVDQLNGFVGGIVELSRQLASKIRDVLEKGSVVRPVVSGYPNVQPQVGAELEGISQNKPWISILGNLFLDARHIS